MLRVFIKEIVCVQAGGAVLEKKKVTKGHNHPFTVISAFRLQTENALTLMG